MMGCFVTFKTMSSVLSLLMILEQIIGKAYFFSLFEVSRRLEQLVFP